MVKEELNLEKKYLKKVLKEINVQKSKKIGELAYISKERREFSLHFSDDFYTMDDEEALGEGDLLNELDIAESAAKNSIERLKRQEYSPYFGRVDFKECGKRKYESFYIGVNSLAALGKDIPYVCDWRAPVSSLFYDYELGEAKYEAPDYTARGDINLKRQYEIKNSELVNVFDSSLTIGDDILKNVLGKSSTNKMKTIVSTIQRDQNKIIRNSTSKNILVQGVAGSGKTSVALHRIAFLLYQNKNTLKAEDILILSPNTIFSEYISDVLPELGEENMSQMSYYKIASDELAPLGIKIESRESCINKVIGDNKKLNKVAYKHTYEFYESLKQFCNEYFLLNFKPSDLKFGKEVIKASELSKLYNEIYKTKSPAVRVEWIIDYIIDKLNINTAVQEISERLKRIIYPFFQESNILKIYADFLANIGIEYSLNENGEIGYDDIGAILYIANYFFGLNKRKEVKYLIIDEMQDYSFVDYSVLCSLFDCNKTILGDINQCIEKVMSNDDLIKLKEMLNADLIILNKSYRSTYEICNFANTLKNINCQMFERHGDEPEKLKLKSKTIQEFLQEITKNGNYNNYAILTKTGQEAKDIYINLSGIEGVSLNISADDEIGNICIMPTYLAKGLEFDVVIIPNYNKKNYNKYLDNNLLYVACTRALHKLYLVN